MKKIIFTSFAFAFAFAFSYAQSGQEWKLKVSPSLLEHTRNGASAPFLILMSEQADVNGAKQLRSKDAKGKYVYHTLRQTASQTQKGIISYLDAQHIPFHPLIVVNAIRTEGTLATVQAIASRQDVARVIANPPVSFAKPVEWGVDLGAAGL